MRDHLNNRRAPTANDKGKDAYEAMRRVVTSLMINDMGINLIVSSAT